jgi:hypothetical protein
MPKPLTFTEKLDRFPPVAVRLLARRIAPDGHTVIALGDGEIAKASGLSISQVRTLSRLTNAGSIEIDIQQAFYRGCGANLDDRDWLRKNAAYMQSIKSTPRYLLKSPHWTTTFEPLITIWLKYEQAKAA